MDFLDFFIPALDMIALYILLGWYDESRDKS